jgi:glycosyltransferase involved in cell wall biosynthesis
MLKGIPNAVVHEPVPSKELPAYLSAADALISPYSENKLSNMIVHLKTLEYAASGSPVVATSTKGQRDIFGDIDNAELVEPENPYDLANGINHVLYSSHKYLDTSCRKHLKKYSFPYISQYLYQAYLDVLSR